MTKISFSKEVLENILNHSQFYMNQAVLVKRIENLGPSNSQMLAK